jgi:hypothetical protein
MHLSHTGSSDFECVYKTFEDGIFLECSAVQSRGIIPTFQKCVLPL